MTPYEDINNRQPASIGDGAVTTPACFVMEFMVQDADLLAEVVRKWDLEFGQLDRGPIEAGLAHVASGDVLISDCSLTRRVEQNGRAPKGGRTLAVPATDEMRLRWQGMALDGTSMMLFPEDGEFHSVSDERFHVFTISVSERLLQSIAHRRGFDSLQRLGSGSAVLGSSPRTRRRLRGVVSRLREAATHRPESIGDPGFRIALEEELVNGLLDAVDESQQVHGRPIARARSEVLRKALELIADRGDEPVSIAVIQEVTGSTGRTLRYTFHEAFGVSPKQCLQAYRLNMVRRQLRRVEPGTRSVAQIANEWGGWHMGQFAKDFRRMFGELPSSTRDGLQPPVA